MKRSWSGVERREAEEAPATESVGKDRALGAPCLGFSAMAGSRSPLETRVSDAAVAQW
jgi:hypothetical protein